jgi:hypothetical protein
MKTLLSFVMLIGACAVNLEGLSRKLDAPLEASAIPQSELRTSQSPAPLPNSCAIIATEASARLRHAGVWTRMIHVNYREQGSHANCGHMMTVWQPFPGSEILIYDDYFLRSTYELHTRRQNAAAIAHEFAKLKHVDVVTAYFLK